jgi:hypothetical protein
MVERLTTVGQSREEFPVEDDENILEGEQPQTVYAQQRVSKRA